MKKARCWTRFGLATEGAPPTPLKSAAASSACSSGSSGSLGSGVALSMPSNRPSPLVSMPLNKSAPVCGSFTASGAASDTAGVAGFGGSTGWKPNVPFTAEKSMKPSSFFSSFSGAAAREGTGSGGAS